MATDDDSDFRDNDVIHFNPVENQYIKIFSDGTAQIKQVPPLGQSSSLSTNAVDQGQYPGPLTSLTQGTVLVTTIPCTTVAPTTVAVVVNNTNNVNTNANANANAVVFAGVSSLITSGTNGAGAGVGVIFLWALAELLGLLLLAALSYLIFRYCARFCTGSSSWSDGCGCNKAKTPRHIRPFSQDRGTSRQKEDFRSAKKEVEEEEEEEVIQAPPPAVVYGMPQTKGQRFLRVRKLVPVKPQQVKVMSLVSVPPNAAIFPNGTYIPAPTGPSSPGPPAPGPPRNLFSYQPAPVGSPTGQNTQPVQGRLNS